MNSEGEAKGGEMPLLDHLRELRKRLLVSLGLIAAGSVICYWIAPDIFRILCEPYYRSFPSHSLIGTGPAEAIMLRLNVSVIGGAILMSPLLFHQLWLFIKPGLKQTERNLFLPFILLTSALFLAGILFCYFVMLPLSMQFFESQYSELGLAPQVRMSEHLSLIVHLLVAFGVIFEMPVLSFFLARLGIVNYEMMLGWGRQAVVGIFIIAAVLTPPDVVSQVSMAVPLLVLFGLSILIARFAGAARTRKNIS